METEIRIPKLPETKKLEFLAFMIWVALIGAILILMIDYQIKSAILQASAKAWEGIDAFKTEQRGPSHTANSTGAFHGPVRIVSSAEVENGTMGPGNSSPPAETRGGNTANGNPPKRSPRARNTGIPPTGKPVES